MLQCENVAAWKCCSVEMLQCGNVVVWKCCSVEMLQCGNVAVWKCCSVKMLQGFTHLISHSETDVGITLAGRVFAQ